MRTTAQRGSRSLGLVRPNRKLQALRINQGLSPNALAHRAGVAGNTVRAAERGITPSPHVQLAVAEALGVEPLDVWPLDRQAVA